jgi:YD repeat-containing protein
MLLNTAKCMKTMQIVKTVAVSLALMGILTAKAQQPSRELLNLKVVPPSPNVAALGKFGEIPVGTYTGTPSVSVPLWSEQVGGFNLSLSLSYHAGGVRVEEIAPSTGQGWSLSGAASGSVSRTTRGLPDDQPERGWLALPALPQDIFDLNNPVNAENLTKGAYDSEADLFYFNFNGLSGKFFLDKNGAVHQVPQTRIKIEYTTGALDDPDSYGNITQWKITGTDGTVYLFREQEYTKTLFTGGGSFFPTKAYVSAWHIKTVKAPNGVVLANYLYDANNLNYRQRTGEIKYHNVLNGATMGNQMPDQLEQFSAIELRGKKLREINTRSGTRVLLGYETGDNYRCDYMGDRALRELKVLSSAGQTVKQYRLMYGYNGQPGTYTTCPMPANGLFASDETKRLTLQAVETVNPATGQLQSAHTLEYHPIQVDRSSKSQDHWGYYNGATNNILVPPYFNTFTGTELEGGNRGCVPAHALAGTLKKITYPTGGYSEFELENHQQGDVVFYNPVAANASLNGMEAQPWQTIHLVNDENRPIKFRFALQGFPPSFTDPGCWLRFSLMDANGAATLATATFNMSSGTGTQETSLNLATGSYRVQWEASFNGCPITDPFSFLLSWNNRVANNWAGGLRVKSIIHADGAGGTVKKVYRYVKADGSPSGRLLTKPKYDHIATHNRLVPSGLPAVISLPIVTSMLVRSSTSNLPLTYTQGATVGYERVEELVDDNGTAGKTVYHYSIVPDPDPVGHPYTPMNSSEWQRGMLTKQEVLKYEGGAYTPVSQTEHFYGVQTTILDTTALRSIKLGQLEFGLEGTAHQIPFHLMYKAQVYHPQTGWIAKTETKQTDYGTGGSALVQRQFFETDPQYFVTTKTTTWFNATGTENTETVLRYPWQQALLPGADATSLQALVAQNRLGEVIEKKEYRNGSLLFTQRTNYALFGTDQWLPSNIQTAARSNPLQVKARLNAYDGVGNILEQRKENDVLHTYLWGYNKTYPVAEVTGAGHATVSALVNQTLLDNPLATPAQIRAETDKVRTALAGTAAQVNTYAYSPSVGMVSHTAPNGKSLYYSYDYFGRLSTVTNHDGRVVKKICYRYNGQPEDCGLYQSIALSQVFIRNNCPAGQTGGAVTFSVPIGMFSSAISQADADAQALAYLNTAGQAYANANGTCTNNNVCVNCTGIQKKCINGVCETGIAITTNCYYNPATGQYEHTYHYEFSDGSWSADVTEYSNFAICFY